MRDWNFGYVRSLLAIGALAGTVSCSGAGPGGAPGTSAGVPAAPSNSSMSNSPLLTRSETTATVTPDASLAPLGDLDATDIAALDVPPTSDVAPVGAATDSIQYNWNITGNYSGLIKQWFDGVEQTGSFAFSVVNSPPKPFFGGSGTIANGQSSSSALMQGRIVHTFEHSVALTFSLSFGPGETCFVTGTARHYRHVFEGVLKSPAGGLGCSLYTNSTAYFKVQPSS